MFLKNIINSLKMIYKSKKLASQLREDFLSVMGNNLYLIIRKEDIDLMAINDDGHIYYSFNINRDFIYLETNEVVNINMECLTQSQRELLIGDIKNCVSNKDNNDEENCWKLFKSRKDIYNHKFEIDADIVGDKINVNVVSIDKISLNKDSVKDLLGRENQIVNDDIHLDIVSAIKLIWLEKGIVSYIYNLYQMVGTDTDSNIYKLLNLENELSCFKRSYSNFEKSNYKKRFPSCLLLH